MNIAVIPARGGSKRIPKKNQKSFLGQPIIVYSIHAALESKLFTKVIVSTDDESIAKIAREAGADVPFIRPLELADDYTGLGDVIAHTVNYLSDHGEKPNSVCCILATAPFVSANTLKNSFKQFNDSTMDYLLPVVSYNFPIQRAITVDNTNQAHMLNPENYFTRSQDLTEAWHDAGQFYWGSAEAWKESRPFYQNNTSAFPVSRYMAQDIDTLEDWEHAEQLHVLLKQKNENNYE